MNVMETRKLTFKKDFSKDSFKLIELNTPEQIDAFQSGTTLVIKGLEDDDAVLCTDSKTFIIRRMHNSNSTLLINNEYGVEDTVSSTIDLIPCLGRLDRIDSLLSGIAYEGEENEEKVLKGKTLYTMKDMLSIVQASEKELRSGLEKRNVFMYKAYCRTFDKTWLFRLFDAFMTNAMVHSLDIQQITLERAKDCILEEKSTLGEETDIPEEILKAALCVFAKLDGERLRFDERMLCRFLGEWLLSNPRNKSWPLQEFMQVWKTLGHDLFIPRLEHLEGLYVMHERIRMQQKEQSLRYFPLSELPTDPTRRFSALFEAKERWRLEELEAFLADIANTKKEKELLLFRYARKSEENKAVYYTSRIK